MWRMVLIATATSVGLSLSVVNVQAQRTDVDVDEGLISPSKPAVQPRGQPTVTKHTQNTASANARTRGGSKTGSDCRPAGSRRCTTPGSR
jgi:hypothetical protein